MISCKRRLRSVYRNVDVPSLACPPFPSFPSPMRPHPCKSSSGFGNAVTSLRLSMQSLTATRFMVHLKWKSYFWWQKSTINHLSVSWMELTSKSYVEITDNLIKSSDVRTPSSVYSTHLCGKLYTPKVPNYHKATVFIPTFFYPHEVYYFLVQLLSSPGLQKDLHCSVHVKLDKMKEYCVTIYF